MRSLSTILPDASSELTRAPEAEALALLEKGIALCGRWEQFTAQQFAALERKDLQAFSAAHLSQLSLADQLYDLELRWQKLVRTFQQNPTEGEREKGSSSLQASLRAKQLEFVAAARRASAANYLTAKALAASMLLQAVCEPLAAVKGGQTYSRDGRAQAGHRSITVALDREG